MITKSLLALMALALMLFGLAACGFVADYVLPRIKPLERWIESLPMMEEDQK